MKTATRLSPLLFWTLLGLSISAGLADQTAAPVPQTTHFEIPNTDDGLPGSGSIRRYDWFRELWKDRRSAWAQQRNQSDDFTPEPGYESLFNGRDLTGWGFRPTSQADIEARTRWQASDPDAADWPIVTESTDFAGQTSTADGRFLARNGRLIVTTPAEGRRIQQLWTTREFPKDFILKLEFRATPNADSGVYVRGPQLQCRDYLLAGPYKNLKHYKPQEWNEIVVTVTGGAARSTCNGEVLEEALPIPPTGPIGLEGDRGQIEYRRIRIRELR